MPSRERVAAFSFIKNIFISINFRLRGKGLQISCLSQTSVQQSPLRQKEYNRVQKQFSRTRTDFSRAPKCTIIEAINPYEIEIQK